MKILLTVIGFLLLFASLIDAQNIMNKSDFKTPPNSAKVNIWWHWAGGNITKDGITRDLESMQKQGVVQATILNVGVIPSIADIPPVKFNSPEWIEMFQWALKEATRLNITIGFHNCDGWSTSGGPWITPEMSMKQYVWSKSFAEGGQDISLKLAQPEGLENFYRDVAIVAYPVSVDLNSFQQAVAEIMVNKVLAGSALTDGNPKTEIKIRKGDIIDIAFDSVFAAEKLVLFPHLPFSWDDMAKITAQFTISYSNDGEVYTKLADQEFSGVNKSITASFPITKAKFFRVEFVKSNCIYIDHYPIAELELLKDNETPAFTPGISSILEKTASVFDVHENVFDLNGLNIKKSIPENSIINLTGKMSADGILKWKVPEGRWQILRFGYTSSGVKNGPATPEGTGLEVDKMDTTALNVHFSSFAGKIIDQAGAYTGNTLKFVLIDSWECQFQNWSKNFPGEFKNRRGYDILPWIPVLCGETVENTQLSEAFLHDFRKTISDLIDQHYYKHFSELCRRNQMEMHAEVIYSNYGGYPPLDVLRSNQYVDLPMTEFWANPNSNQFPEYQPLKRPVPGFSVYSALAAHKQIIGSEAYTGYAHYSESPSDLKPFGDAAYCSGVNQLILHSYVHQPSDKKPGITLGKFAAHFNRNNPWWEYSQDWLTYQSRIQYLLQQGEPVVDVIFYAGDQFPQNFSKSFISDLPYGIQANACNFDMLKNEARVIDGKISFGGNQSFPVVMLPDSKKMELATLQQIAALVKDGAVFYGPKPVEMLSVPEIKNDASAFNKLADALWGNSGENLYGKGKMISAKSIGEILSQLNVLPDLTTNSPYPGEILFIHKKIGDSDVYFVFNQQNKRLNREMLFRITGKTPEIWNPENGSISKPAVYSVEKNQTRIPVSFKPYESFLFVFKNEVPDHFIQKVSMDGKEIFPQIRMIDTLSEVPQAVYDQGTFGFTTSLAGDYVFTTNDNQIITRNLEIPKVLKIEDIKARIEFMPISNELIPPVEISSLKSFTTFNDPAIKYFAGKATYTIAFNAPPSFISASDSIVLDLGNMDATAEVFLNGKLLAYAWMPHQCIDITGILEANNKLEVTVANVCRNRLIGDLMQYGSVTSLWTTSPVETILSRDMPLKPSGLMGPLKLIGYAKQ